MRPVGAAVAASSQPDKKMCVQMSHAFTLLPAKFIGLCMVHVCMYACMRVPTVLFQAYGDTVYVMRKPRIWTILGLFVQTSASTFAHAILGLPAQS